jgi:uncharacterized protein (DUF427 family)
MTTYRASWNGAVIAESEHTVRVEGNQYFPPASVNRDLVTESPTTSQCPWKGSAKYYSLTVDGAVNRDAGWYYPHPSQAAEKIRDHVAFWNGVKVAKVAGSDPLANQPGVSWWAKMTKRR